MFAYEFFEGKKYKCTCHPGDPDPDCPEHGLEPMEVGDALDVKNEAKQRLDPKCWKGYRKAGTKMKGGVRVNNCVPANEGREHDEGDREPPNNFAIYINGKKWKVFPGLGYYADDFREQAQHRKLKDWCQKKSQATGKRWEVYVTGEPVTESNLNEKWSNKYKRSINCSHPKGFSQRAHCAGRKKNEAADLTMVCPDCGWSKEGLAEGRFDEPLTGWHIVSRAHGQVVRGTPSFETKDQAQKYLMTRMFANHQDFKVVHTAGVAEGLIGRLAAAGALVTGLGMAGHYLDRTAPKVSIQGNMAYVVPEDHGKIPPNALTLKGDDGITYRVWMSKRKDVFAYPVKDAQRTDEQGMAEGSMPYPHGKPEAGDKITWYHSNHYPSIEGTVVGWKDGHLIVKSIDPSPRNTEKTVVKYRVPKNNILSVEKQGVAEGEQSGLLEKQDACYHKVRSRYKVWPSAYASGALVQCRKKGAANWGTGGKKK